MTIDWKTILRLKVSDVDDSEKFLCFYYYNPTSEVVLEPESCYVHKILLEKRTTGIYANNTVHFTEVCAEENRYFFDKKEKDTLTSGFFKVIPLSHIPDDMLFYGSIAGYGEIAAEIQKSYLEYVGDGA